MLKTEKESVVADLAERLREAETLIVADYRGLTHKEIDGVRTELLKHGARFAVCKNTLTRRAAQEAGVDGLVEFLTGPTAIAFVVDGDMVAVAKTLDDTARATRRMSLKGGVLAGRSIDADGVKGLASLPPADVLRGQVLGAIVAPLTSLMGLVAAPLQSLVGLIDARIDQLGGEAAASDTSAPAASSEPAPEAGAPEQPSEGGASEPVNEEAAIDSGSDTAEPESQGEPAAEAAAGDEDTVTTDESLAPEEPAAEGEEQE